MLYDLTVRRRACWELLGPASQPKLLTRKQLDVQATQAAQANGYKGLLVTDQVRIKIDDDQVTPKQRPVAFSVMDIDGKRPPHSDYRKGMIQQFRLLHSVLVKTASTKELNKNPLNSNELIDFMIDKDGRLLLMCVLALATGKTSFDEFKKEEGYDKASLLSVYMATDLIVRAVQIHEIGPAVRCMSNMFRHAPESRCHDLLSSFRVVVSSKASIKDEQTAKGGNQAGKEIRWRS